MNKNLTVWNTHENKFWPIKVRIQTLSGQNLGYDMCNDWWIYFSIYVYIHICLVTKKIIHICLTSLSKIIKLYTQSILLPFQFWCINSWSVSHFLMVNFRFSLKTIVGNYLNIMCYQLKSAACTLLFISNLILYFYRF